MTIRRSLQQMLGCSVVLLFCTVNCAQVNGQNEGNSHSVLSIQNALQADSEMMAMSHHLFTSSLDASQMSAPVPLPEPYSYVLASVGIASLLAMGSIFRKRKNPPTGASKDTVPRRKTDRRSGLSYR